MSLWSVSSDTEAKNALSVATDAKDYILRDLLAMAEK